MIVYPGHVTVSRGGVEARQTGHTIERTDGAAPRQGSRLWSRGPAAAASPTVGTPGARTCRGRVIAKVSEAAEVGRQVQRTPEGFSGGSVARVV